MMELNDGEHGEGNEGLGNKLQQQLRLSPALSHSCPPQICIHLEDKGNIQCFNLESLVSLNAKYKYIMFPVQE